MARKACRTAVTSELMLAPRSTQCTECGQPMWVTYHTQRASRRKCASPGLVVRGAVRVVASVASRLCPFSGAELCLADPMRWRTLRSELDHRQEARRMQHRFRKSPENYLAALEEKLIKERLPS